MIERYPSDLDGAIVFWPATHLGTASLQFGRIARALAQPGAPLSPQASGRVGRGGSGL